MRRLFYSQGAIKQGNYSEELASKSKEEELIDREGRETQYL